MASCRLHRLPVFRHRVMINHRLLLDRRRGPETPWLLEFGYLLPGR
jgi:hypothetical protein